MRIRAALAAVILVSGLGASAVGAAPAWASNNGDSKTTMNACVLSTNNCAVHPVVAHYGQAVDFLINVDDDSGSCGPTHIDCDIPHGTVELHDGDPNTTPALTSTTLTGDSFFTYRSSAEPQFAGLAPGHHDVTARYVSIPGDNGFNPSVSGPEGVDVSKEGTSTSLSQSSTSNVVGQGPDLTATVTSNDVPDTAHGALKPGGQVQFLDGSTLLGTSNVDANTGQATWHAGTLGGGPHSLSANYLGDTNYSGSQSSTISHSVTQGGTTTVAVITPTSAVAGQIVSFSNTVTPVAPAAGTPTGTVTYKDNGNLFGTSPANGSIGSSPLSLGSHSFVATYPGDSSFTGSTSDPVSVTVSKANTTTALTGPSSSTGGQSVTFTATVSVVSPGAGTRTGTVQFKDGAANLGAPQPVNSSGVATFTTASLAPGSHQISAIYSGDTNFNGSTSSPVSETVTCDRTLSGSVSKPSGSSGTTTCVSGASVSGGLTVPAGAKVAVFNSTIGGGITANGPGQVVLCQTNVTGGVNVTVTNSTGSVVIGDPSAACAGGSIGGGLLVSNNSGGVKVVGNTITGGATFNGNTNGTEIGANNISSGLACSGNVPPPTNGGRPNTVSGGRTGQCSALTF